MARRGWHAFHTQTRASCMEYLANLRVQIDILLARERTTEEMPATSTEVL